jgi:hypothetical protein
MKLQTQSVLRVTSVALLFLATPGFLLCQTQQSGDGTQLSIKANSPLKAFLRQQFRIQLESRGGVMPFTWKIASGDLPPGLSLGSDGVLSGAPSATGDFRFTVTVTDNGRPVHERSQEMLVRVLSPLLIQWSHPAAVTGQRIEGSIKVSNQTEKDFDLTAVIVAVNETGRATALGYQHFLLKQDIADLEIPFGENLPAGSYEINVDVVAEIAETNTIHRARLVTPGKLQIKPTL